MLDRHGLTAGEVVYGGLRAAAAMGASSDWHLRISDEEMAAVRVYQKKMMKKMRAVSSEELHERMEKMKGCGLL